MTTLLIPPPAVPVDVTAEQVVAYLLARGWMGLGTAHGRTLFERRGSVVFVPLGAAGPAYYAEMWSLGETIEQIARAEGRHPLAVAEEIAGPARGASVGMGCEQ